MSKNIILKGITWNHSRGLLPMVATAQRFAELNPGVEITWEKRSLQQFADFSIQELAERFDLLVIDHPWAGFASKTKSIIPLDEYLPADYLKDQEVNSVGASYESYNFNSHQWALPIDAATPVAASRPDLFAEKGLSLPKSFEDLLALADKGLVAFAGIPIDVLMNFYTLCCSLGEDPCQTDDEVISPKIGVKALEMYRQLATKIDKADIYKDILTHLGENPEREGLIKTPERVAKALQYLTHGYDIKPEEILRSAMFKEEYSQMVVVKDIEVFSMCEHHMLPFFGKAHIAYIPNGHIVGLSKIPRVVDAFARRLQVQERLTNEIRDCIQDTLNPAGVAVVMECKHLCMAMRGVQKQNSVTTTSAFTGGFLNNDKTRAEFIRLIGTSLV